MSAGAGTPAAGAAGPGAPTSWLPTAGLSYDPSEPRYWDPEALAKETRRAFEICHGCRLCFKFCDAFPTLFDLIDGRHEGDAGAVTPEEADAVAGSCFQCKLCEVQCPYTPRDGHAFQLDVPRLLHRRRAQDFRERGARRRERLLGDPDRAGRMARASLGLVNVLQRRRAFRWLQERLLGIDRRKLLPPFARRSFTRWAARAGRIAAEPGGEAVLFPTCYVEHNEPAIGRDALEVLAHNGVDVRCARGLVCCGMPAWEHGDLGTLRAKARRNLDILLPFVERGAKVVVVNPTCAMTLRREWPTLLEGEDRARAARLAAAVTDPGELLWSLREEPRFRRDFRSAPRGTVAYHAPCHLRAQAVGFRGRDLLRLLPGVTPVLTQACSGHDGTWAMTVEGFEPSRRIGGKAMEEMAEAQAGLWVSDCPLAALQFRQHAGRRTLHPMTVLAMAYRGDPFEGPAT